MTASQDNIFLVGCMGAGKTTIGRQLGRRLGMPFMDSDHVIEERTGVRIPLIFDIEGERGFREREQRVIDELTQMQGIVLATGGGAVLAAENRKHLHERGTVIYLCAPLEQLLARTSRDKNRPLLATDNPRQRLQTLLEERDPLYREVADLIVNTRHRTVKQIINRICTHLNENTDS